MNIRELTIVFLTLFLSQVLENVGKIRIVDLRTVFDMDEDFDTGGCEYFHSPPPVLCQNGAEFNENFTGAWTPDFCSPSTEISCTIAYYFGLESYEKVVRSEQRVYKNSFYNYSVLFRDDDTEQTFFEIEYKNFGWSQMSKNITNEHGNFSIRILWSSPFQQEKTESELNKSSDGNYQTSDADFFFVDSIKLFIEDGENCTIYCNGTDSTGDDWLICSGETSYKKCDSRISDEEFKIWSCSYEGDFETPNPDYSNCSDFMLIHIIELIKNAETIPVKNATELMRDIEKIIDSEKYYGHRIKVIMNITGLILAKLDENASLNEFEILTDNLGLIFSKLVKNQKPWREIDSKEKIETGMVFIKVLEESAFRLAKKAEIETISLKKNYLKNFNSFSEYKFSSGLRSLDANKLTFPNEFSKRSDSYIELPNDWADYFPDFKNVKYSGIQLKSTFTNFIFNNQSLRHSNENFSVIDPTIPETVINGDLLAFSLENNGTFLPLPIKFNGSGVRIVFRHEVYSWGSSLNVRRKLHKDEKPAGIFKTSTCTFLDSKGYWSKEGCQVIENSNEFTVCECTHLSSFALLMDIHNYTGKDQGLEILSWTLVSSSLLCLFLLVGIFYILDSVKTLRTPRTLITANLCGSLIVAYVLLITVSDRDVFHIGKGLCTAVGALTHYAFLCSFFWMALEGHMLYKMLFEIFDNVKSNKILTFLFGYGAPAIFVIFTLVLSHIKNENAYQTELFCWLNGSYLWSFIGPVAFILVCNFIMLILSLIKSYKAKTQNKFMRKNSKGINKSYLAVWLRGSFFLSTLLGLTWTAGYFMLIDNKDLANISAYFFTVLNASQGILLFVSHVILNEEMRRSVWNQFHKIFPEYIASKAKNSSDTRNTS